MATFGNIWRLLDTFGIKWECPINIATKLRMFGPLIIDEGASLSMTAGRATYAALLRGDIVTLVSFVKILIQILL